MKAHHYLFIAVSVAIVTICGAQRPAPPKPAEAITSAAEKLVAALSEEQRGLAMMDFDSPERVKWHFIPLDKRKGLELNLLRKDENFGAKLALVGDLLKAALTDPPKPKPEGAEGEAPPERRDNGYFKAKTIMQLENILFELEESKGNRKFARDPLKYYLTFFGKPAKEGKWGFSFEGHHLSLNYVIEGDKVLSTTPMFFGANPADVKDDYKSGVSRGIKKGMRVLEKEEDLAFKLLAALNAKQLKQAMIAAKAPADIRGPNTPQPPPGKPEGVKAFDMTDVQKNMLRDIIYAHAESLPKQLAKKRTDDIEVDGFFNVHFAWAGADKPGEGHYYRIQGPTVLIEFINVQPDAAGNVANHIHSVWRDMRGDFGVPAAAGAAAPAK